MSNPPKSSSKKPSKPTRVVESPEGYYHEITRLIERMHRRYLDVIRLELSRLAVDDISPVQVMMMINIGHEEISVRDLIERGYYLGSNASYNLKQLVDCGYVERSASQRDKRLARLKLSSKGAELYTKIRALEATHLETLSRHFSGEAELEATYKVMRRMERTWSDIIRYDQFDDFD